MKTIQSFLATGLTKGFAGQTTFTSTIRAGFTLQVSDLPDGDNVYHDEWAADRTGGGQELVKVGTQKYTRVYAGGTISDAAMQKLAIDKKQVMEFLVSCLNQAGEATRFDTNYGPLQKDDWTYQYAVLEKNDSIPMATGKEDIRYKGQVVFTHVFVMCPVE